MLDKSNENCGIFGAYDLEKRRNVTPLVIHGLTRLQHRGQLSAGITSSLETRSAVLKTFKNNGLVRDVFRLEDPTQAGELAERYEGTACIGHTRYATSGNTNRTVAQPFEYKESMLPRWVAFCFNGNMANFQELSDQLKAEK